MIADMASHGGEKRTLQADKGEHLRRLARFALVDDVPDPWGFGAGRAGPQTRFGRSAQDD
jgi:hypothetical protein